MLFGADPLDEFFSISPWITAIAGSVLLLWLYRLFVGSRAGGRTI